jgi:hypothetical protein
LQLLYPIPASIYASWPALTRVAEKKLDRRSSPINVSYTFATCIAPIVRNSKVHA